MAYKDRFRSQDAMEKFLAAYDATMALWPVPYETMQIETAYGMTHTHVVGSPELPPLVLIHGGQISSTVWYPNVEALSQHFRVYMPDVVDAAGRSVKSRKLQDRQDCTDWMTEVIDKLNIERATLIGHCHGGWMILNYAILMPERVETPGIAQSGGNFAVTRRDVPVDAASIYHTNTGCILPLAAMDYDEATECA